MHFEAMINDKAPGKRFIASNNHMFFPEIAKVLNDNGFKAPKIKIPWICLITPEMRVSEGYYPGYLYIKETNTLILSYGIK